MLLELPNLYSWEMVVSICASVILTTIVFSYPPRLNSNHQTIKFKKTDHRAVTPTRAHVTDIGVDLTAIKVEKTYGDVVLFNTGLQVMPPEGYYTEIVPRSSLSKTGYMLANSVGIIDPSYRGDLMIALRQVDMNAERLEPPFCKCQLVMRKAEYFNMDEVVELNETKRGDGGFGSSDVIQ